MEISTNVVSGVLVMAITGRMDSNNALELAVARQDFPDLPVILDMIHVEYINSSALRGLLEFNRRLQTHGTRLLLVESTNGFTDKILKITGFNQIFQIFPSVPDAVNAQAREKSASTKEHPKSEKAVSKSGKSTSNGYSERSKK